MGHANTSTVLGQNCVRRREGAATVGPREAQRTTKPSARIATDTSGPSSSAAPAPTVLLIAQTGSSPTFVVY